MKILWVPQVSSKSADGKILFDKDSNIAFFRNLMNSDFGKNNQIDLCLEFSPNTDQTSFLKGIVKLHANYKHQFTNAFQERLHFDIDFYNSIDLKSYDIIFCNEPTKATNLRMLLGDHNKTSIVSYNHWLAMDNMKRLELRQLEGMINSDLCLFNSHYVIDRITAYCDMRGIRYPVMDVLEPSFDIKYSSGMKQFDKVSGIIYNHRLSSDEYYMKAYRSLIEVLNRVEAQVGTESMPLVYFTNPSGKDFDITRDKKYFRMLSLDSQEQYYNFLLSDSIQVHLNTFFESKGMWSMSTVEAGVTGNICLLPHRFGYKEIYEEDYEGYCHNEINMINKLTIMLKETINKSIFANSSLMRYNNKNQGKRLNEMLTELLERW